MTTVIAADLADVSGSCPRSAEQGVAPGAFWVRITDLAALYPFVAP
jgi:hypothetical protein